MDNIWKDVKESQEQPLTKKLATGIFCFKVISIKAPKRVTNKYDKVHNKNKKKYLDSIMKTEDYVSKYNICNVSILVKYWTKKLLVDQGVNFENKLVRTEITLPILQLIRSHLDIFIEHDIPEPDLIVYWKPNKLTVKYTFLYEKDYYKYVELFKKNDKVMLAEEFYWMGRKEYFDENKMLEWYK